MVSIYSDTVSPRLEYICDVILREQLGLPYQFISFPEEAADGPLINYSLKKITGNSLQVIPCGLLSENDIRQVSIEVVNLPEKDHAGREIPAFFGSAAGDLPFDIFAASFYLLSRYEEHLPYSPDAYGRFPYQNSLAFKNGWLDRPLVNIWIQLFRQKLSDRFPAIKMNPPVFNAFLTYDIDMAWSYRNKGILRNMGAFLKRPGMERLRVLAGLRKDPYDSFGFLHELHQHTNHPIIYFFLVARKRGRHDKNISPDCRPMRQLIKEHARQYATGLHPSWKSHESTDIVVQEKNILESITGNRIIHSRQHYLQFRLPHDFENLIKAGIENDFSMGYGGINGFRASFAGSFFWYNLSSDTTTPLRLYPFCFMDANCHYHRGLQAEEAGNELSFFLNECKKTEGLFISVFHNHVLGDDRPFRGWREMYRRFISQLQG